MLHLEKSPLPTRRATAAEKKTRRNDDSQWMNLEDIMAGRRSWSQKGKTVGFHLNEVPRVVELRDRKQTGDRQGLGEVEKGNCVVGVTFQFCSMKKF